MVTTFKIYFISNFQVYKVYTSISTIVTVLYITSPELIYLITGNWYALTTVTGLPHIVISGSHQSIPCFYEVSFFNSPHLSEIIQYYSLSLWLIVLSVMPSEFISVLQMSGFTSFYGWYIFHCVYMPHFLYLLVWQWRLGYFPCFDYCK